VLSHYTVGKRLAFGDHILGLRYMLYNPPLDIHDIPLPIAIFLHLVFKRGVWFCSQKMQQMPLDGHSFHYYM